MNDTTGNLRLTAAHSSAVGDLVSAGRVARTRVPREDLARWDPATRTRPAVDILLAQNEERDAALVPIRFGRMSSSPWAYLRGAASVMAEDMARYPNSGLTVQLCGDAHVLNYGLWASPERNLLFDLRDFDETLPGPFEWDVKRLAASLIVCADDNQLSGSTGKKAVQAAVRAYNEHIHRYAGMSELDVWYDQIPVDDLLASLSTKDQVSLGKRVARAAKKRSSAGAFSALTEIKDGRRVITDDPPFRVHLDFGNVAQDLATARSVFNTYSKTIPAYLKTLTDRFDLTDVVRQVVGVGSVGMRVYLVLAEGRSGQAPMFLQIKQAGASVYEPALGPSAHANHGQRVVIGQHLLQSATDLFSGWTRLNGMDYYVRQFRDMKVIPSGPQIAPYLVPFAAACGHALAKAHARSGQPVAIAAYIGSGARFTAAISEFAQAYAHQTHIDHHDLQAAIDDGSIPAVAGWAIR